MTAQIINAQQGSDAWHQHRATHFNASDAPAMLGISSYKSRNALLQEKVTGLAEEIDEPTQRRFDKGHEYERIARPWAEEIIGEDLYPVVLAETVEQLPLSASVDGVTLLNDTAWEHKTLNERLAKSLDQDEIPEEYHPQMEQVLMLSGAERCLFMASAGDRESMRYAWYESSPKVRKQLIAGWKQFREDMQSYQPTEDAPKPAGSAPEDLPALRIEVQGEVTASNLESFKGHALAVFESISTELQTDEDFASAEKACKWCKQVEERLEAAKQHALSQTESIDALFRTIDDIKEQARQKRLELDKLVKARKQAIRDEILRDSKYALDDHIKSIERSLESEGLKAGAIDELVSADFASAMKGKKTVKSLRDAADDVLAKAKIQANEWAERIRTNLRRFAELADGYESLFPDKGALACKPADDMEAAVKARIAEHEAEKKRREEQRQAEAKRRGEAEQARQDPAAEAPDKDAPVAEQPAQAAPAEQADDGARIKLSDINARIAPLRIDANGLAQLGFESVGRDKAAKLYRASDLPAILKAMVRHIEQAQEADREAA